MIKNLAFKIVRYSLKSYIPMITPKHYNKLFNLSYRMFVYLRPSQLWVIILALLNKTELKSLISIPSLFILFNTVLSNTYEPDLDEKTFQARLDFYKFINSDNDWEKFFWVLIILALIKRFISNLFKILWIPFKIAIIYFILKYLGFDFSYAYNILNNLSLGIIDWFHNKITNFFDLFNNNPNDKNN